jgi:hypothetical protein
MKYAVDMGSDAMIYIPSFMTIGSGSQKLFVGIHTEAQTYTQTHSKVISRAYFHFVKISILPSNKTGWTTEELEFHSRQMQGILLLSITFRQSLGPMQPSTQWVPGVDSVGSGGRGVKRTIRLHPVPRLRMVELYLQRDSWRNA